MSEDDTQDTGKRSPIRPIDSNSGSGRFADGQVEETQSTAVEEESGALEASDDFEGYDASPLHKVLFPLYEIKQNGDPLRARIGFKNIADSLEQSAADLTPESESVWLDSVRLEFDSSLDAKDATDGIEHLRKRTGRFKLPVWSDIAERTSRYYREMISLSIDTGLEEKALDLYEQGRDHVTLTPELRLKLLELSTRLGRTDPGTARLCIDELRDGAGRNSEESQRLFQIVRNVIRVDLIKPADKFVAEFLELNILMEEVADVPWVIGHRAMACVRLGRHEEGVALCRQKKRLRQADTETSIQIGATLYFSRRWRGAQFWLERAAKPGDAKLAPLAGFLRDLERLNRVLFFDPSESDETFRDSARGALSGIEGRARTDAWRLDADWLAGCAYVVLGQPDEGMVCFERAPDRLARWSVAELAQDTIRISSAEDRSAAWSQRFAEEQPALTLLLEARDSIDLSQFADGRQKLQEAWHIHEETIKRDSEMASAAKCLQQEIALSEAAPTPVFKAELSPVCADWIEQLTVRRHFERLEIADAEKLIVRARWNTASADRKVRLAAVHRVLTKPDDEETGQQLLRLATEPSALPVDHLHYGLWLCRRSKFQEAIPFLENLGGECADSLEAQLARVECSLRAPVVDGSHDPSTAPDQRSPDQELPGGAVGRPPHNEGRPPHNEGRPPHNEGRPPHDKRRPPHSSELKQRAEASLTEIATLANWQNERQFAWFRPWQDLLPRAADIPHATVAPARIGDALHAVDLMLEVEMIEPASRTLLHVEQLLCGDRDVLQQPVGKRFAQAAALEAQHSNWENGCLLHRQAASRNAGDESFTHQVATAFEAEETAPDNVLEVLFDWVQAFDGSEERFLLDPPCRVFHVLVRIEVESPETEGELTRRLNWIERFHQLRPDWDLPKRSQSRVHVRRSAPQQVVETIESLKQRTQDDDRLLGHALWELGRFAESGDAFERAKEPGWTGCARAAARFAVMFQNEEPLPAKEASRLLSLLDTEGLEGELQQRVRFWRGAVETAAGNVESALKEFDALGEVAGRLADDVRILRGLCLLRAGRNSDTAALWKPENIPDDENALAEACLQWNRREVCLWMLIRLQDPCQVGLLQIHRILEQFQRLGQTSDEYRIAQAELALRTNTPETAREAVDAVTANKKGAADDIVLASLRPVIRGEREFVRIRLTMREGDSAAQISNFKQNADLRIFSDDNQYWMAVCQLNSGNLRKAEPPLRTLWESQHCAAGSQLALLSIRQGDFEPAEALCQAVLAIDPGHPFALFALAKIHEQAGRIDEAATCCRQILERGWVETGRRLCSMARQTLGRFACADGRPREGLEEFREACRVSPESPFAERRLGLLLIANAENDSEFAEADRLLETAHRKSPDDAHVLLGRACVADKLQPIETFADRLADLMASKQYGELPSDVRRQLAIFSADTHLRLKRFGDAASAFENLLKDEADPKIEARLRRCHLLEAIQLLQKTRMPDGALERVLHAAEAVCADPDPPVVAVLLRLIVKVLLLECQSDEERQAALDTIDDLTIKDPGAQQIACIARFFLGAEEAQREIDERFGGEDQLDARRWLELLAANAGRDGARLFQEAQRIVDTGDFLAAGPFDNQDLIYTGALSAGSRKADDGCDLLIAWHSKQDGSPETHQLHAQLLARLAVKSLKKKEFGETQQLLGKALARAAGTKGG